MVSTLTLEDAMPLDVETLKTMLGSHVRGRGKKYPDELRQQIIETAEDLHDHDWTWVAISDALGMTPKALRSLMKRGQGGAPVMRPVKVTAPRVPIDSTPSGLSITGPGGWRLHGLSLEDAVSVLKRLAC